VVVHGLVYGTAATAEPVARRREASILPRLRTESISNKYFFFFIFPFFSTFKNLWASPVRGGCKNCGGSSICENNRERSKRTAYGRSSPNTITGMNKVPKKKKVSTEDH
jgi:hypothetical protein